jgi:hypothetical protein
MHIHNGTTKKNEIMPFVGKWVEQEIIILSEINQAQTPNTECFHSYEEFRSKITKITIIMGFRCKRDGGRGAQQVREGKWRRNVGEEEQSMLFIFVRR